MVRPEERPGSPQDANEGKKGTFMFRKSALAIAMLGALTTANVAALGLGEIELKSALNQPLNAEVELLSATPAEMQELRVQIASSEAFASAGIDRPLFLTKLNFNVSKNADGKPVVRISSRDVVREPFLDFLLEISWSKGRLLREDTVLVDFTIRNIGSSRLEQVSVGFFAVAYPVALVAGGSDFVREVCLDLPVERALLRPLGAL